MWVVAAHQASKRARHPQYSSSSNNNNNKRKVAAADAWRGRGDCFGGLAVWFVYLLACLFVGRAMVVSPWR